MQRPGFCDRHLKTFKYNFEKKLHNNNKTKRTQTINNIGGGNLCLVWIIA